MSQPLYPQGKSPHYALNKSLQVSPDILEKWKKSLAPARFEHQISQSIV
jgi:hypothetical protein